MASTRKGKKGTKFLSNAKARRNTIPDTSFNFGRNVSSTSNPFG